MIAGVFLVNYLNDSALEQKILPTYTSVSLGGTDTEIFLEKTSNLLEENQELKDRIERSALEAQQAQIQTTELAGQISLLQEQMNALEDIKSESLSKSAQLEDEVSQLRQQIATLETAPSEAQLAEISALKETIAQLEAAKSESEDQGRITELEEQVSSLQVLIAELESGTAAQPSEEQLSQIAALEAKIAALEEEKEELVVVDDSRIAELENKIKELETKRTSNATSSVFEQLSGFEAEIETVTQAKVPKVVMTEDTITWEFVDSKNNKYSFSKLTDTFIDEVIRIPAPQDVLNIELINGNEQQVRDLSKFVTGSILAAEDLYKNVATDDEFLFEVWFIVSQFELTSASLQNDPKKPLDTFAKGEGDNEDLAILFADIIKSTSAGKTWKMTFIYFDSNNISQPQEINHVALLVDNGKNTWFIETTAKTIDDAFQSREQVRGHIIPIK